MLLCNSKTVKLKANCLFCKTLEENDHVNVAIANVSGVHHYVAS